MKFLFSLLIIVTLTESCSTAKNTMENKIEDTTKQSNISGTYTVENAVATTKALTLTFDENSTKVSGFSGCNRFFGTYIVSEENSIAFTNIGTSKKYCQQELNTVERNFIKALSSVNSFTIKDTNLSLLQNKTPLINATKVADVSSKQAINDSKKGLHNSSQSITYTTIARGAFNYVSISGANISISKDANLKSIDTYTCNKKDWEALMSLLKQVDVLNLQKLDAPTEKRLYDGAAHATLDIMLGDMIVRSPSFDHGHPPKEIEALVNKVLSIKENALK